MIEQKNRVMVSGGPRRMSLFGLLSRNRQKKVQDQAHHHQPSQDLVPEQATIDKRNEAFSRQCLPQEEDLQVHILSFLSEQDLMTVMQVSHDFYQLLRHEPSGQYLWTCLAQGKWPYATPPSTSWDETSSVPNWSKLLKLGDTTFPTALDICNLSRDMNVGAGTLQAQNNDHGDMFMTVAQFTGQVGLESRSVRSNHPLPRPKLLRAASPKQSKARTNKGRNILGKRQASQQDEEPKWQPFVVPFCQSIGPVHHYHSFVPRTISYFEVSICNQDQDPAKRRMSSLEPPSPSQGRLPCVAVGLSLDSFPLDRRMPGWERDSFGFHGDDGTAFGQGARKDVKKQFGPCFGAGDVVGCGIDYRKQAVFYTLNGNFLDYAHTLTKEQLQQDWYPCIGLDAAMPVECNFGTQRPFCFDVASMVRKSSDQKYLCDLLAARRRR